MQPGDTITPNTGNEPQEFKADEPIKLPSSNPAPPAEAVITPNTSPLNTDTPQHNPQLPEPEQPPAAEVPPAPLAPQPEPAATWHYEPDSNALAASAAPTEAISWTASEYIDHEKRASWFIGLSLAAVAVAALLYFITDDVVTAVVVFIVAALFGVTGARKPRTLNYQLDSSGVSIASKYYPYDSFKSFTVVNEGAFNSVQLLPLKRFMPTISLYYPPDHEESILRALSDYLPHEEQSRDPIDRLMRKVRF